MSDVQKLVAAILGAVVLVVVAVAAYFKISITTPDIPPVVSDSGPVVTDTMPPQDTTVPPEDVVVPDNVVVPEPDTVPPMPIVEGLVSPSDIPAITQLDYSLFPTLPSFVVPANRIQTEGSALQQAINDASEGAFIVVTSDFVSDTALTINKPLTIVGTGDGVTLTFTSSQGVVIRSSNVVLHNLNIIGGTSVGLLFAAPGENYVLSNIKISNTREGIAQWFNGSTNNLLAYYVSVINYTSVGFHCGQGPCNNWRLEHVVIDGRNAGGSWGADAFAVESGNNFLFVDVNILGSGADGIDVKATNAVLLKCFTNNVSNNAVKLWHGGDIIASTMIHAGGPPLIVAEAGILRIVDSVISSGDATRRTYPIIMSYDFNNPMQLILERNIISWYSGKIYISPATLPENIHMNDNKWFWINGGEMIRHGDTYVYWNTFNTMNGLYGSGNVQLESHFVP